MMNILIVAQESAGVQALRMLAQRGHRICAVLTRAPSEAGAVHGATVDAMARKLGYPTLHAELVKDPAFATQVQRERVDIILNIHSLFIMHAAVAASARLGAFNLHPGPLPAYAGLNAPSWAILHGETQHGVTVHWMEEGIDTGPIAYQRLFPLTDADTGLTVAHRCVREGLELIAELVDTAATEPAAIPRRTQDLSRRSYFGREVPHGGALDWSWPARRVVDFVRACDYHPLPSPWGYPSTRADGATLAIARARCTGDPTTAPPGTVVGRSDAVRVACADEWVEVSHVWREGRRVSAADVIRRVSHLTAA